MKQSYACCVKQDLGAGVKGVPFKLRLRRPDIQSADFSLEEVTYFEKLLKQESARTVDCEFLTVMLEGQDGSELIRRGEEAARIHFQLCRTKSDFESVRSHLERQRVGFLPWKLRRQHDYFTKVAILRAIRFPNSPSI